MQNLRVGTYTGTGAAINIQLGFVPDAVLIFNQTDSDIIGIWFNGMTDGTSIDIAAAVAANTDNGISDYLGTEGGNKAGFTAGTDFSENAKVYRYLAFRNP